MSCVIEIPFLLSFSSYSHQPYSASDYDNYTIIKKDYIIIDMTKVTMYPVIDFTCDSCCSDSEYCHCKEFENFDLFNRW